MRTNFAIFSLAVSLLCSSVSGATTIGFDDTYGPTAVPFPASPLVTLSLFDPALGTLTKVTLTLDASTSAGSIAFDNEAIVSSDVTLGIGAEVTVVGLAALTAIAVPLQIGSSTVDADNDGAADFVGTDAFSVIGGSGVDSDFAELIAGLAPYIGLGTFDVEVSSVVETFLSTTGGFGPIDPTPGTTSGTVTVTYEFIPIPEPSTALLLSLGLVGMAAMRKRPNQA